MGHEYDIMFVAQNRPGCIRVSSLNSSEWNASMTHELPGAGRCACGSMHRCALDGVHVNESILPPARVTSAIDIRPMLPNSSDANQRTDATRVPRIVHQTWKGCSADLPPRQAAWRERCMLLNPDWTFWLWTDDDNRELIKQHYPHFLGVYDSYDVKMKRIDAARIFYLHRYGGIYLDLDFTCLKPFTKLALPSGVAVFSHQYPMHLVAKKSDAVANNFMATPPAHPLYGFLIRKLVLSARKSLLYATGPNFLTHGIVAFITKGGCNVEVYMQPGIYRGHWSKTNNLPCGNGTDAQIDFCSQWGNANASLLATFWTMTWKGVK